MSNQKVFRRGEQILKEGERANSIFVIQSGMVSICLAKQKKNVELYKATVGQVIGEEALFGLPSTASATAIGETVVFELPSDPAKAVIDASNSMVKQLFKSVVEKQKNIVSELRSLKAEQDPTPCPPDNIAKVFACLFHVANYYGEKKDGKIIIQWNKLKKLAQRLFLESPLRLEQAFNVCIKLKLAEVVWVKPDIAENKDAAKDKDKSKEMPEEMGPCTFHDMKPIERFFEFYQNYHFKGASASILRYDEKCRETVGALLKVSEGEKMDRSGVVYLNYKTTCENLKGVLGEKFNPEQIMRLESKGLFVKRQSNDKGGILSFIRTEFEEMLECWKVLREVEKWNELGYVDLKEGQAPPPKAEAKSGEAAAGGATCPTCLSQVPENAKFCSSCGCKLGGQAAA